MDSLRGEDSTGIAAVTKGDPKVNVVKQLGSPFELFQEKKFENAISKPNKVLIGHNRYATSGGVSRRTAHPFEFDTLVGVHNGTLGSKWRLLDHNDFKVDSENLYHHIEQKGIRSAINELPGEHNAWALVWWDKLEDKLHMLRNDKRPLYICYTEDWSVMFWASEPWMLASVLGRNDVRYTDITLLPEDVLRSIHIDRNGTLGKPSLSRVAAPVYVAPAPSPTVYTGQKVASTPSPAPAPAAGGTDTKKIQSPRSETSSYLLSKGVKLEILSTSKDEHGNPYLVCFDPNNPELSVRLYPRKEDSIGEGDEITGDISACVSLPNGVYYKVSPWTVKLTSKQTLFKTYHGNFVPADVWKKLYSLCCYCNDLLNPEDDNRFTTGGDCLCPSCATDKNVTQYVNLQ